VGYIEECIDIPVGCKEERLIIKPNKAEYAVTVSA
jgi:hypothetical protein